MLWAISGNTVLRFNREGEQLPQQIFSYERVTPSDIVIDKNGRLLACNQDVTQQIHTYENITPAPRLSAFRTSSFSLPTPCTWRRFFFATALITRPTAKLPYLRSFLRRGPIPTKAPGLPLPTAADVRVTVYNALGQKVRTLLDARRDAGVHTLSWCGQNDADVPVAGGIYLIRMEVDGQSFTQKALLVK